MEARTTTIGHSSTVTVALLAVLLGLSFALGMGYERLGVNEKRDDRQDALIEQQSRIIMQNQRLIEILKDRDDRREAEGG